ncbi:MAG TPA: hypothetical protein QF753_00525 [Victivallales bacterium]|nr:hypothetical protein [Victivallales bacterium]
MKKSLSLIGVVLGLLFLISSCSSVPKNANLTGKWLYDYGENLDQKGSMSLNQDGYEVTGTSNNVDGQYTITGKVVGSKFNYEGQSDKNTFTASCDLTSENAFEGSYTSTSGTAGDIEARRVK